MVEGGYKGLQGVTKGYKGLQGLTRGYRVLHRGTGGYKRLQGITKDYNHLGLGGKPLYSSVVKLNATNPTPLNIETVLNLLNLYETMRQN